MQSYRYIITTVEFFNVLKIIPLDYQYPDICIYFQLPDGVVAYTDDAFVARSQKHHISNNIEHTKKYAGYTDSKNNPFEQKIYELGDLNPRRSLSGDIAVYNFNDNFGNSMVKKKWQGYIPFRNKYEVMYT